MAILATTRPTILDWVNRKDPDGQLAMIAELLTQENTILEDMPFVMANGTTHHRTTIRSGLPSGTWRQLNYGVQPEKSRTVQVDDQLGMLETYLEQDKALADMSGDTPKFRLQETNGAMAGFRNTMATTLFYGDTTVTADRFMGLSKRYDDLSAGNAENIILGGGSGSDNMSVWLVNWGEDRVHGLFPKGSVAGLSFMDKGQVTLQDTASPPGNYEGYRAHLKWDMGLCLRDWRYVVRIANIDSSLLTADISSGADLNDLMIQALYQIQSLDGNPIWYVTRRVGSFLHRQLLQRTNMNLTWDNPEGGPIPRMSYAGIPVRMTDALTATEATVS